jgi:hypothetical protein
LLSAFPAGGVRNGHPSRFLPACSIVGQPCLLLQQIERALLASADVNRSERITCRSPELETGGGNAGGRGFFGGSCGESPGSRRVFVAGS